MPGYDSWKTRSPDDELYHGVPYGDEEETMSEPTEAELDAVRRGDGIIKNGRYFNTGKTYNSDGTVRFDFDASNKHDPWFNGDTFHGYDEEGCPIWNKAR